MSQLTGAQMFNYIAQILGAAVAVALVWAMWSPRVLRMAHISRHLKSLKEKDAFLASRHGRYLIRSYRWSGSVFFALVILRLRPISLPISFWGAVIVGAVVCIGLFLVPLKVGATESAIEEN